MFLAASIAPWARYSACPLKFLTTEIFVEDSDVASNTETSVAAVNAANTA